MKNTQFISVSQSSLVFRDFKKILVWFWTALYRYLTALNVNFNYSKIYLCYSFKMAYQYPLTSQDLSFHALDEFITTFITNGI